MRQCSFITQLRITEGASAIATVLGGKQVMDFLKEMDENPNSAQVNEPPVQSFSVHDLKHGRKQ